VNRMPHPYRSPVLQHPIWITQTDGGQYTQRVQQPAAIANELQISSTSTHNIAVALKPGNATVETVSGELIPNCVINCSSSSESSDDFSLCTLYHNTRLANPVTSEKKFAIFS